MIPENLLNILCCPVDKAKLEQTESFLICTQCKRKFEIRGEILILLEDKAIQDNNKT